MFLANEVFSIPQPGEGRAERICELTQKPGNCLRQAPALPLLLEMLTRQYAGESDRTMLEKDAKGPVCRKKLAKSIYLQTGSLLPKTKSL